MFLWSVNIVKGWNAISSHLCHSSRVRLTANNTLFLMSSLCSAGESFFGEGGDLVKLGFLTKSLRQNHFYPGRVWVLQDRCCGKCCLYLVDSFFSSWFPWFFFLGGLFKNGGERGGNGAETPNETAVEISESKETLKVLDRLQCGPLHHYYYLGLINSYSLRINNISQKQYCGHMKFTLFSFDI